MHRTCLLAVPLLFFLHRHDDVTPSWFRTLESHVLRVPNGSGMKKWSSPSSLSSPSVLVWCVAAPRKQHSCLHFYCATTQWSFIGPGSEKKWYFIEENSPQGIWDHIADKMLLEFAESGCPTFRATTPLSRCNLKSKEHGKLSIHFIADYPTIETIFRIIVFANQFSIYGAVANICEEFEAHQGRSGEPDVLMGQSIVLSEIKAEVLLENDIPSHQNLLLQRYEERIKLLSQENKVSKFCRDAGFIHVVEIGQYFMTKDTEEQFFARACREYTLPRSDGSSQPKGWIQGNTKIGPVLEVTTSCLYGKHGVEIRIWSLSEDNTQSWVRISHGSNKFVIDSNYNNTEVPADLPEEQASQSILKDFACQIKSESKTTKKRTC